MPARPTRAAPAPAPDSPMAPHQLWGSLAISQQQHVRTVLSRVAPHGVASLLPHRSAEERSAAPPSAAQPREAPVAPPGTPSRDRYPPIQSPTGT
jgi:hypothetical protein